MYYIESRYKNVWNRKTRTWINPQELTLAELQKQCAYPTFSGCNRVAMAMPWNNVESPKQWGRIYVNYLRGL